MSKNLLEQFPHIINLNDPIGMYQLMQDYLLFLKVQNYAESTCDARELFLCFFLDWSGQRGLNRPTEITKLMLERYQRHLYLYRKKDGGPMSFRSQYNRLIAIRSWFKWLSKHNYILFNPAADIELPKLEKRLPKAILTASEAEIVINTPDINTAIGLRNRAILEVFYSTGIRRTELINLKIQDLDVDRGTIMIRQGKGKTDRMIPIGERALLWIEKYFEEARPNLVTNSDEGIVFLSLTGQTISGDGLTALVTKIIQKSDVNKQGSCHLFRHTMATLMLEHGANIRYIQAMLGHIKLETTQIYTQVCIKKLKEIHTLTHPAKVNKVPKPSEVLSETDVGKEAEATEEALLSALKDEEKEEKGSI